MKTALLLFFVVIMAVHAQNNVTLDCEHNKIKFTVQEVLQIPYLNNITINNTVCGTEYQAYGSCCDIDRLKAKGTELNNSLYAAADKLKKEYAAFSAAVTELQSEITVLAESTEQPDDTLATRRREHAIAINGSQAFVFLSTHFRANRQADFNSSLDKCFPAVSNARSSALCILCAARSPFFLTDDEQVIIGNDQCNQISGDCKDALNNLRTFAQGLQLYTTAVSQVATAHLGISVDISRVDIRGVVVLGEHLSGERIASGHAANTDEAKGIICNSVLSAGKPTIFEAMAELFNPNADWTVTSISEDINANISKLDVRTEELESLLADGFRTEPELPADPISTGVNAILNSVNAKVTTLETTRRAARRRLQQIGNRLDAATFKSYLDQLDSIIFGRIVGSSQNLNPTFIRTGSDLDLGNGYDLYLNTALSVLNEKLYELGTSGRRTVAYTAPPATNPPKIDLTNVLRPLIQTPINLKLN